MFRGNREVYGGGTTFGSSSTVFKSSISGHPLSNLWCAAHRFCFLGVDIKNAGPTGLPRNGKLWRFGNSILNRELAVQVMDGLGRPWGK